VDEGWPIFLHNVADPPEPGWRGAITTRNERFVSAAGLNERKYWTSREQLADEEED
jgi:hypothetical protein